MPSLLRSTFDHAESEGQSDEDEESLDYTGHVLALNGHKRYFCLFRPVFTGDSSNDSSSETSFSDRKRKSRSRSRSSSHSRSRSHSREDGACPKRGSSRATSIEVHHKLDRLGLWMERLMEGTLPRFQVPVWPALDETTNTSFTESWGQSSRCTLWSHPMFKFLSKKSTEQSLLFKLLFKALAQRYVVTLNSFN